MRRSHFAAVFGALLLAASCEAPPPSALASAQLRALSEAELTPFLDRVEAVRELRFERPVSASRVAPAALPALLARELDRVSTPAEITREAQLAASLGLLPPGFDLRATVLRFEAESVAGFYSPLESRLYVVDGQASAAGDSRDALIVHELTHALQAQHSDLFEALLGIRGDDDLLFALSALLEGEASYVELADAEARGGAARPTAAVFAQRFAIAAIAPELPRAVGESLIAPYPLGYALAERLVARGGVRAFDAAYLDPPLTSAELLHPARAEDAATREPLVALPREPRLAGCRARASNCYGELGVRAWLEDLGAGRAAAARAAEGWDTDRAWRFSCGARVASAWLIEASDPEEARELSEPLRALAPRADGAALELTQRANRMLVSSGLTAREREALLGTRATQRFTRLADYLAAHPEVRAHARRLRR
jgi:hypothetical protein